MMNEILYSFDQIIYQGFSSFEHEHAGYEQLLRRTGGRRCCVGPSYDVCFAKDVKSNRSYYAGLIESEGKGFLHALHREMDAAFSECERSFFADEALNILEQKLERTALLTCDHILDDSLIFTADAGELDSMYILQLLKSQLIGLYLEVQEQFKFYLKRNVLTLEDIHRVIFREPVPEQALVVKVCKEAADEMMVEEPVASYEEDRFEPIMNDTVTPKKGVLIYADIVAHKTKFARLEIDLFDNELLDSDYRFKRKPHGNVLKMAALYWMAFKKGFFKKYYFKEKRKIEVTANDVRQFLNHRYQTNIERQFQNFRDEDVLNEYLEREVWISFIDQG